MDPQRIEKVIFEGNIISVTGKSALKTENSKLKKKNKVSEQENTTTLNYVER